MPDGPDPTRPRIAAVEARAPVEMVAVNSILATGKLIHLAVPADFNADDALCLHQVVGQVYDQMKARQQAMSPIVVAHHMPPAPNGRPQ